MSTQEIKIYCLVDPISCKIRYIGRTSKKKLEHRLIEHLSKSKYHHKYYPNKKAPYRVNWINSLLKKGREPKIRLLCIIKGWKESYKLEKHLINKYKDKFNLVNTDDRGEGGLNRKVTIEQREKISKSLKEFYSNEENKLRYYKKPIYTYDTKGIFQKKYLNVNEVIKDIKISKTQLFRMLKNNKKLPSKGFYFKHFFVENIPIIEKKYKYVLINKNTKEVLKFNGIGTLKKHFNMGIFSSLSNLLLNKKFNSLLKDYDFYLNDKLYLPSL